MRPPPRTRGGLDRRQTKMNETTTRQRCPVHGHALVNVHKVRDGHRVVIGQICPEPHCAHAEMEPRSLTPQNPPAKRAAV